ncbi:MAG: hypothetical protein ACP5QH_05945 [Thermoplasmata archaeon]|jgi:hypothetical protein
MKETLIIGSIVFTGSDEMKKKEVIETVTNYLDIDEHFIDIVGKEKIEEVQFEFRNPSSHINGWTMKKLQNYLLSQKEGGVVMNASIKFWYLPRPQKYIEI